VVWLQVIFRRTACAPRQRLLHLSALHSAQLVTLTGKDIICGNQYQQMIRYKEECHMSPKEVQAKIQWAGEEAWLEGNVDALNEA
jgi:hypothetical protein